MLNWNFGKLSTAEYKANTYVIDNAFADISLNTRTADITFTPSADGKCKVVCYEEDNLNHTVTAEDNTLKIQLVDQRKWYSYIGIRLDSPKITVYLPAGEYGALTLRVSTGNRKRFQV